MYDFIELCKMTQFQLKAYVTEQLVLFGYKPETEDGYVYARELGCPVLLTAHLDTVHKEPVRDVVVSETGAISSPQGIGGDDRCGVYIILSLIAKTNYRPAILFCEDEEIGGVGSSKFCKRSDLVDEVKHLKFMIELDRMGKNDAVYYDDDNADFHAFVEEITGYTANYGSFSDISHLMPETGISGVNLSCGYYRPHTISEYVVAEEMDRTESAVEKLCDAASKDNCPSYAFTESGWNDMYLQIFYSDDRELLPISRPHITCTESACEALYRCESEADGFLQFFEEHPLLCWSDIIGYQVL